MAYLKPELFLVGTAQGLVLGAETEGLWSDHDSACGSQVSRNDPLKC